jgi:hypothetical protein
MTTLSTGRRETVHLPAYHTLTVVASASGSGVVWRLDVSERTAVAAGEAEVIGPYAVPTQFTINADNDTITYTVAPAELPSLAQMMDFWINQSPLYVIPVRGAVDSENLIFEYRGDGAPDASAKASITIDPDGDDNALIFTADGFGPSGNDISIEYVDPGAEDSALAVTGTLSDDGSFAIVVSLATDETGTITTTAAEILAEVNSVMEGWVTVTIDDSDGGSEDDGSGVVTAMAATNLEGGTGVGCGEAGTGSRYTDITTPALYINTGDAAEPVWAALAFAD